MGPTPPASWSTGPATQSAIAADEQQPAGPLEEPRELTRGDEARRSGPPDRDGYAHTEGEQAVERERGLDRVGMTMRQPRLIPPRVEFDGAGAPLIYSPCSRCMLSNYSHVFNSHSSPARLQARKFPQQSRSQETVEAIVGAATQVFERHGYAAGTTNRIAERAGVSIGPLYQYFPNKDAILVAWTSATSSKAAALTPLMADAATATRARGP